MCSERRGHGHRNADGRHPAYSPPVMHAFLQRTQVADALSAVEQCKVSLHLFRALVTAPLCSFARLEHYLVELQRFKACVLRKPLRRHLRKLFWCVASHGLVKHHAERVKVGAGPSRALRGNVTLRADKRSSLTLSGQQTDVRQLCAAVHEDDVAWLHVAMHQAAVMQAREPAHNVERHAKAVRDGQAAKVLQLGAERAWRISSN